MSQDLFSDEAFNELFKKLLTIEYRRLSVQEILEELKGKTEVFIHPVKHAKSGIEWIYEFRIGNWICRVCTSYRSAPKNGNEKDDYIAWVMLYHQDYPKVKLYSFEIRRSTEENFFKKILQYAVAFKEIALSLGIFCPQCGDELRLMHIPKVMHEMVFTCRNTANRHPQWRLTLYFTETGISDESKIFLEGEFARNSRQKKYEEGKGIYRTPKRVIRAQKKIDLKK